MCSRHIVLAVLLSAVPAVAQDSPWPFGLIAIRPAKGTIDSQFKATFSARRWNLLFRASSDGIDPATEQVTIRIGGTDTIVLPAEMLRATKNGKRFAYRDDD